MKGLTIKLEEATLKRLQAEARESGRSVASLVRERVETAWGDGDQSVHALAWDLAGSLDGPRKSATNARRRFARR